MDKQHFDIKSTLRALGVRPSKGRGQNFLTNAQAIDEIVSWAEIRPDETVVEIGPGLGMLTEKMVGRCKRLLVVEIEETFSKHLSEMIPGLEPQNIIRRDALKLNLEELASSSDEKFVVVSNVPYSISSPLCLWVLENRKHISRASLLLQKEFAERIGASPGTKSYGSLTVFRHLWADAELGPVVSGDDFYPKAKVNSRLVRLSMLNERRVDISDEEFFQRLVRGAFSTRRKTLLNSLSNSGVVGDKAAVRELLEAAQIDPKRRAETLFLEEFAALANTFRPQ